MDIDRNVTEKTTFLCDGCKKRYLASDMWFKTVEGRDKFNKGYATEVIWARAVNKQFSRLYVLRQTVCSETCYNSTLFKSLRDWLKHFYPEIDTNKLYYAITHSVQQDNKRRGYYK